MSGYSRPGGGIAAEVDPFAIKTLTGRAPNESGNITPTFGDIAGSLDAARVAVAAANSNPAEALSVRLPKLIDNTSAQSAAGRKTFTGGISTLLSGIKSNNRIGGSGGVMHPFQGFMAAPYDANAGSDFLVPQLDSLFRFYEARGGTISVDGTSGLSVAAVRNVLHNRVKGASSDTISVPANSELIITLSGVSISNQGTVANWMFVAIGSGAVNGTVRFEASSDAGINWVSKGLYDLSASDPANAGDVSRMICSQEGSQGNAHRITVAATTQSIVLGFVGYLSNNHSIQLRNVLADRGGTHHAPLAHSNISGIAKRNAFQTLGLNRLDIGTNATAETGSNTGSDVELRTFADNGSTVTGTTTINRASHLWTLPAGLKPSASSDTLATYTTRGTWTPSLVGETTAGAPTYVVRQGTFSRVGDVVTVNVHLQASALGGAAGNLRISGLPFTSNAANPTLAENVDADNAGTSTGDMSVTVRLAPATNHLALFKNSIVGGAQRITAAGVANPTFIATLTYSV